MLKYIRKNQKKMLAVFSVFLMIVFILPSVTKNPRGGDSVEGTISNGSGGKIKIYGRELAQSKSEWDLLKRIQFPQMIPSGVPGLSRPGLVPFVYGLSPIVSDPATGNTGSIAYGNIERHPDMYLLLQKEAQRMGETVSPERLNSTLLTIEQYNKGLMNDEDLQPRVEQAVRNFLLVQAAYNQAASVIKISSPYRDQALANQFQQIRLKLVEFASDNSTAAEAPTTQQIDEQFLVYRDEDPGSTANPFGFGYRYPNQVKLQYIGVPYAQILRQIEQSRTDHDWEVEEYRYYLKNKESFAATQPAPTTSPLSLNSLPEAAVKSSVKAGYKPFEQVRDEIKTRILNPEVQRRMDAIRNAIVTTLNADWTTHYRDLTAKASAQPESIARISSQGVPYVSVDYLPRLALMIQKQFGVLPKVVSLQDSLRTAKELANESGIGRSRSAELGGVDFSTYVSVMGQAFVPASQQDNSNVLNLFKPSQVLRDDANNIYVFRLTAMDPAHSPTDKNAVLNRVKQDLTVASTFAKVRERADNFLNSLQNTTLETAAAKAGKKVITTGFIPNRPGAEIDNYLVNGPANAAFISQAFQLLAEAGRSANPHPTGLIELQREGKVLVAQIDGIRPDWDKDSKTFLETRINSEINDSFSQAFQIAWFDFDSLSARLKYISERPSKPRTQQENPTTPQPAL